MIEKGHYHLVGGAGVGMSALAELLLDLQCTVTASDRYFDLGISLPAIDCLQRQGAVFFPQDGSGINDRTKAVVVSTAIEGDNPELAAAQRERVPIRHRAEVLAEFTRERSCIAITGTSGKSTVTGMIGFVLTRLGLDPTVVNGAALVDWESEDRVGSARFGQSEVCVVEADESDRSLLRFTPEWAVLTNVASDHFGLSETQALFTTFLSGARAGVVDMSRGEIKLDAPPEIGASGSSFVYRGVNFQIELPGGHNVQNALSAVELCRRTGCDLDAVSREIRHFKGLKRRLEGVGESGGVRVIDDYAHNPAKISASWSAVEPFCQCVHCIWRPHGYGPLTKMQDDLREVFDRICDSSGRVYILPVYDVGGTADRSFGSEEFVAKLGSAGRSALFVDGYQACEEAVMDSVGEGDVVLCMGARDPGLPVFCRRILDRLHAS